MLHSASITMCIDSSQLRCPVNVYNFWRQVFVLQTIQLSTTASSDSSHHSSLNASYYPHSLNCQQEEGDVSQDN